MIGDLISSVMSRSRMAVQLFAYGLMGAIMVPLGLPLVFFGVWEGLIPLGLGSLALHNCYKLILEIARG